MADAVRALAELRDLVGPVPVVLVGHSMGARAALRAAGDAQVRGVVALAPWCPPGEPVDHLRGRTVVALHDPKDRVTRAPDTWSLLTRARHGGARVLGVQMPAGGHTMIRGACQWHRIAAQAVAALLGLGPLPTGWEQSTRGSRDACGNEGTNILMASGTSSAPRLTEPASPPSVPTTSSGAGPTPGRRVRTAPPSRQSTSSGHSTG